MRTALTVLLLLCTHAHAELPEAWHGSYSGTVHSATPAGKSFGFPMRLDIAPADDPDRFTWIIIYGEGERIDRREYELVVVDAEAGHYQIDERNSIVLDAYLADNALVSVFEVADSHLVTTYRLDGDTIEFTIVSTRTEPVATTGGGGIPEARSYRVNSVQRAVLTRNNP